MKTPLINTALNTSTLQQYWKATSKPVGWWQQTPVALCFVLFLTLVDAANLYNLFGQLILDNPLVLVLMTLGISLCLNLAGLLCAFYLRSPRYSNKMVVLIMFGFTVLIIAVGYLRFSVSDTGLNSAIDLITGLDIPLDTTEGNAHRALKILLTIVPIITTVIAFAIGMVTEDPQSNQLRRELQKRAKLQDALTNLQAVAAELENSDDYVAKMRDLVEARFQNVQVDLENFANMMKSWIRFEMAVKENNPLAISLLSISPGEK